MLKRFRRAVMALPNSLLFAFALFALLPLWSVSVVSPYDLLTVHDGQATLWTLTYWVLPLAICWAILTRSFLIVWLFLADCAGLVILSLTGAETGGLVATKLTLVGISVIAGGFVLQKDLLFPFMTKGARFWRRSPRYFVNHQIMLRAAEVANFQAMIEDCSSTGMAVAATSATAARLEKGLAAEVTLVGGGRSIVASVRVVWVFRTGEMVRLGLETLDAGAMQQIFLAVSKRTVRGRSVARSLERLWAVSAVRRTALVLFGTSVSASFGMPACGNMQQDATRVNHRTGSIRSVATEAADGTGAVAPENSPWRRLTSIDQGSDGLRFALAPNDDAGLLVDAGAVVPGAVILIAKGSVKQPTTLIVRAGAPFNVAEFLTWMDLPSEPQAKASMATLAFSTDAATPAVPVTIRLPIGSGNGQSSDVGSQALVALYRVVRDGKAVAGVVPPTNTPTVSQGPRFALDDGASSGFVEFAVDGSLEANVQLVELTTEEGVASGERAADEGSGFPGEGASTGGTGDTAGSGLDGGGQADTTAGGQTTGTGSMRELVKKPAPFPEDIEPSQPNTNNAPGGAELNELELASEGPVTIKANDDSCAVVQTHLCVKVHNSCDDTPISGADVTVLDPNLWPGFAGQTGGDGQFCPADPLPPSLQGNPTVTKQGFFDAMGTSFKSGLSPSEVSNVALRPKTTMAQVAVFSRCGSRSLPGARVSIDLGNNQIVSSTTDQNGTAEFQGIPIQGAFPLTVSANGHVTKQTTVNTPVCYRSYLPPAASVVLDLDSDSVCQPTVDAFAGPTAGLVQKSAGLTLTDSNVGTCHLQYERGNWHCAITFAYPGCGNYCGAGSVTVNYTVSGDLPCANSPSGFSGGIGVCVAYAGTIIDGQATSCPGPAINAPQGNGLFATSGSATPFSLEVNYGINRRDDPSLPRFVDEATAAALYCGAPGTIRVTK